MSQFWSSQELCKETSRHYEMLRDDLHRIGYNVNGKKDWYLINKLIDESLRLREMACVNATLEAKKIGK
jgi:hypothetical protein